MSNHNQYGLDWQNISQRTAYQDAASRAFESAQRYQKNAQKVWENQEINRVQGELWNGPSPKDIQSDMPVMSFLDVGLLPREAAEFCRQVAASLRVQIELVLVTLLGAVTTAVRGRFQIVISPQWAEVLTLFLVTAALSGTRKSAVLTVMKRPFLEFQREIQGTFKSETQDVLRVLKRTRGAIEAKVASKIAGMVAETGCSIDVARQTCCDEFDQLRELDAIIKKAKVLPRILTDLATPEGLAHELDRQGGVLGIMEPEGGLWKAYTEARRDDLLLKGYTGESFGHDTKTLGSIHLESPVLSITTLVQPSVIEGLYRNEDLHDHGLTPRILPCYIGSDVLGRLDPPEIPPSSLEWYKNLIRRLLSLPPRNGQFISLALTSEAQAEIKRFGSQIEQDIAQGRYQHCEAFARKLAGHAVRLAGVIHFMRDGFPEEEAIDLKTIRAGISLSEFFRDHAVFAFNPAGRSALKKAGRILEWIKRDRPVCFKDRDAQREVGHCRVQEIRSALDILHFQGYLGRFTSGKGLIHVVSPQIHNPKIIQLPPSNYFYSP